MHVLIGICFSYGYIYVLNKIFLRCRLNSESNHKIHTYITMNYSIEEINDMKYIRFLDGKLLSIMQSYFPYEDLFRNAVV
jgi:hypothetical protein